MQLPKTIYIDFDGVLTDGKLNMSHDGKTLFKSMHVRDTVAIRELVARGYLVQVVTASSCPIIDAYCEKLGITKAVLRDKGQLPGSYIAIGDSCIDITMLERAALAFHPADAGNWVKQVPGIIPLGTPGGGGVIAEMLEELFRIEKQNKTA